jgi:hypothetical protein
MRNRLALQTKVAARNGSRANMKGSGQMRRIPVPVALLCIFTVSGFSGLI